MRYDQAFDFTEVEWKRGHDRQIEIVELRRAASWILAEDDRRQRRLAAVPEPHVAVEPVPEVPSKWRPLAELKVLRNGMRAKPREEKVSKCGN